MDPDRIGTLDELHDALRALYKASGLSYGKVAGLCKVSTAAIHGMATGGSFPRWSTLAEVLPVWKVAAQDMEAWKRAHERVTADEARRPGQRLTVLDDPFALDVHRSITVDAPGDLSLLPEYVPRAHDRELAERVGQALKGRSVMVVLVAGSSGGKTRALWEALAALKQLGGWRLWKPLQESADSEVRQELGRVRAHTVVWLNETQNYLGNVAGDPQQLAQQIRNLLRDPSRAPVLVLGTLWPDHHDVLCKDSTSPVSKLLEDTVIRVPDAFIGDDLDAMRAAARRDPRLAMAVERARDGEVTQYLAGGPELIRRYQHSASPAARAVIEVAMDLRRLGHRNALPADLLCEIAPFYISDSNWNRVENNWFEQALADLGVHCKGAPGPLTRKRSRRLPAGTTARNEYRAQRPGPAENPSMYQFADYLDQHGRKHRAEEILPIEFWKAAARHAPPKDQVTLGMSAWDRGLYRYATQLWKNATQHGDLWAAVHLIRYRLRAHASDNHAVDWVITHVDVADPSAAADPHAVAGLLGELQKANAKDAATALAEHVNPEHIALNDPHAVAALLGELRRAGAKDAATALAERADSEHIALNGPHTATVSVEMRPGMNVKATAAAIAEGVVPEHILDDPSAVAVLLGELWRANAKDAATALAERVDPEHIALDDPGGGVWLAHAMAEIGHRPPQVLLDRIATRGMFSYLVGDGEAFRFGREPGGAAASAWHWNDLT
ncbi:hypothetical protein ACFYTS_35590 [Nocardia sp. NPDC004151]|uniref:hypothetical protein n=1 Tax=Nocardia sp. NPDC004151 TaxID=3364304 RepID=UPI003682B0A0